MPVPGIVLDGQMGYGVTIGTSGVLTINGVTYKVNNFTVGRDVVEATDNLPNGLPGRARYTLGRDTLDLELQLATDSTVVPQFGQTFTATVDANYGVETWVVMPTSPDQTNDAGEIRVAGNVSCRKVLVGITTVAQ